MVARSYTVRAIAAADREQYDRWIRAAEGRRDGDEAESYREALATWERDQGQPREVLVCAVCGDAWLSPTAKGTARRHQRRDREAASWDQVRQLRKDLAALQDELDRLLAALEP
jgi:rubrerythrin